MKKKNSRNSKIQKKKTKIERVPMRIVLKINLCTTIIINYRYNPIKVQELSVKKKLSTNIHVFFADTFE